MGKERMEPGRGRRPDVVKQGGGAVGGGASGGSKGRHQTPTRPASKASVRPRAKGPFYALLGGIAAVAAIGIAWQASRPTSSGVVAIDPQTPLPRAEGYLAGSDSAPVQVLEFADFECPACGSFATLTEPDVRKRLVATGQISFRFLDFPLPMHPNSWDASMAAACANEQGKFWEMHDEIFMAQDQWAATATNRPKGVLSRLARTVGLDMSRWNECYDSKKYRLNIRANQVEGEKRGVRFTPTFVIGGKMISTAMDYDSFKAYVDSAMALRPPTDSARLTDAPKGVPLKSRTP